MVMHASASPATFASCDTPTKIDTITLPPSPLEVQQIRTATATFTMSCLARRMMSARPAASAGAARRYLSSAAAATAPELEPVTVTKEGGVATLVLNNS